MFIYPLLLTILAILAVVAVAAMLKQTRRTPALQALPIRSAGANRQRYPYSNNH